MLVISRDKPAYTNDDCGGPASNANDDDYGNVWVACNGTISATNAKWLAYDLSSVPAARRQQVVVAWFNDPMTSEYDHTITGGTGYNNVRAYTIQVNAAAGGGAAPTAGWTTVNTVTANSHNSRQHIVDMTGRNWIRLNATASDGSEGNRGVAINMDVHDASAGISDDWLFIGDSITQDGMSHDNRTAAGGATVGTFAQEVNARAPGYFPLYQDAGIGGLASSDGVANIDKWLALFPGRFVTLNYGTNNANNASPGDADIAEPFHDDMAQMVETVLAAGKTPIIPTIPWGATASLRANVPVLNSEIERLRDEYPELLAGPDFYEYFRTHQSQMSPDGIHPTWDQGYAGMRQQWATWAASTDLGRGSLRFRRGAADTGSREGAPAGPSLGVSDLWEW